MMKEIHFPDLQFCRYCEEKFGINRGLYNTIESWFFAKGLSNIIERRMTVLYFLDFLAGGKTNKTGSVKLKVGHGGLTKKLLLFWETRKSVKSGAGNGSRMQGIIPSKEPLSG